MALAGYSGTPLIKKLGIKNDKKVLLLNAPDNYFELLGTTLTGQLCKGKEVPDLVHLFVTTNRIFEKEMRGLIPLIAQKPDIIIWVSWYKKAARMVTDITEDTIRNYALNNNVVDIKVCAVSDWWSGIKLVVPVAKRKKS